MRVSGFLDDPHGLLETSLVIQFLQAGQLTLGDGARLGCVDYPLQRLTVPWWYSCHVR